MGSLRSASWLVLALAAAGCAASSGVELQPDAFRAGPGEAWSDHLDPKLLELPELELRYPVPPGVDGVYVFPFPALEERHREINSLNAELRHQVAERSRELARLSTMPGLPSGSELEVGSEVGGRYRVVRLLGKGAMGSVDKATRVPDGARFALKVMRAGQARR